MKSIWEKIKQFNWTDRRFLLVVVIAALVFLMMDFNNRMVNMLQLDHQEKALSTQVSALKATKSQIEADLAYATSDKALEQWARESGHLINEGDRPIVVIPPANQIITPSPSPQTKTLTLDRWQIWKELFLGQ